MTSRFSRVVSGMLLVIAMTLTSLAGFVPTAVAQTAVVGTADFRNAPQLVPGTYSDRLVTGDSAWYSLVYSNGTPYQFEVAISGTAPAGLTLNASLVAPTLTTVDGPAPTVTGNGVVYPSGHTNIWFLKVSLESTGLAGLEYPVTISVDGVQSVGVADCGDTAGCVLDDEYASLNVELAEAERRLEEIGGQETTSAVTTDIENLRGFADSSAAVLPGAQARLARNEATMAQLCAPDPMCETFPNPGSKVPLLGWAIGGLALVGGAYRAVKKFGASEAAAADTPIAPRAPSAIEKARREGAARRKAEKRAEKKLK